MFHWMRSHAWPLAILSLVVLYLVTHLASLTALPVFADEAIYIRWSQLIISDWRQYLFFPMNDGKTPLFIWSLIPFLQTFTDPLFAGRFFSVLIGLIQMLVIGRLIKVADGGKIAQIAGMLMVIFVPFWYFYHRMALMDGMLTLLLSLTVLGLLQLSKVVNSISLKKQLSPQSFSQLRNKEIFKWSVLTGVFWGLALLTKLPAIFFAPVFPFFVLNTDLRKNWFKKAVIRALPFAVAGAIGLLIFLSLKMHPAFGQLFNRGEDFTYTFSEIIANRGSTIARNIWWLLEWFVPYVSGVVLILTLLAPAILSKKRQAFLILLSGLIFISPFVLLGETIYPRYLLPIIIPMTVLTSLVIEITWQRAKRKSLIVGALTLPIIITSLTFMWPALLNPNQLPLPAIDRMQYLEEWSSGHGIAEVTAIIEIEAESKKVLVLTEGFFGTLPDALLMNFFNKDVSNITIIGVGAPVRGIPEEALQRFDQADVVYLVVNGHRMLIDNRDNFIFTKVQTYLRPNQAPSLDLYEVEYIDTPDTLEN